MNKKSFNKKICGFRSRSELYFFLTKTFLNLKYHGSLHCYCINFNNQEKCGICSINTDFSNFENELNDNKIDEEFKKNIKIEFTPI